MGYKRPPWVIPILWPCSQSQCHMVRMLPVSCGWKTVAKPALHPGPAPCAVVANPVSALTTLLVIPTLCQPVVVRTLTPAPWNMQRCLVQIHHLSILVRHLHLHHHVTVSQWIYPRAPHTAATPHQVHQHHPSWAAACPAWHNDHVLLIIHH